jgi:hypothetical protein
MFREAEVQFQVQLHTPVIFPARQKAHNCEQVGSRARLYSIKRKTPAPANNQILITWMSSLYPTHYFESAIPVSSYSQNKHHWQVNGLG